MTMGHIAAVYKKQNKDTLKNKAIFLQFVIFPVMALILEYGVEIPGMGENYFMALFAIMFLGMAPLTAMSALLSEEKEAQTLTMLRMAGVTPGEYMLGAGGSLMGISLMGSLVFAAIGRLWGWELLAFLGAMAFGILISFLLGAAVGLLSPNQSAATSVTVPVMMIFSFLPMLAMFNDTVAGMARLTYTGQIHLLISQSLKGGDAVEFFLVTGANGLAAAVLFLVAYRKNSFFRIQFK